MSNLDKTSPLVIEAFFHDVHKARKLNAQWLFTLESWIAVWEASGKWDERGIHNHQYTLHRNNNVGVFSVENSSVMTNLELIYIMEEAMQSKRKDCGQFKRFYMYMGVRFETKIQLADTLGYSLRTMDKWVAKGKIEKWNTIKEHKIYVTPIGTFHQAKECLAEVKALYRKDLTRQSLWYRFQCDDYPEFYTEILPEITYKEL